MSAPTANISLKCLYCPGMCEEIQHRDVRDRLGFVAGVWSFLKCSQCGSAILSPFPKLESISGFYPPVYDFSLEASSGIRLVIKKIEHLFFFNRLHVSHSRSVLQYLGLKSGTGKRLLDSGCGRGLRLGAFKNDGFEVSGADISSASVEYVRSQLGVSAVVSTDSELCRQFEPDGFDVLTSFYVIEHDPLVKQSLGSFHQILKPGGGLVLATLLNQSFQSQFFGRKWSGVTEAPRHLTIPTEKGLRRVLAEQGFENIEIKADSLWSCAGVWLLSLFPLLGRRHFERMPFWKVAPIQLLAILLSPIVFMWCFIENHIIQKPGLVLIFAKKKRVE